MSGKYKHLVTCLLNISESNEVIVRKIITAAGETISKEKAGARILNVFSDKEYNRSVLTVSGEPAGVEIAVVAAASQAMSLINMEQHYGSHPRLGAVDLIPIHPLSSDISLQTTAEIAKNIARTIQLKVHASSFFFFGEADPQRRSLIHRRKQIGWFDSQLAIAPDLGQFHDSVGITGVGSSHYMTNFNITIETQDNKIGLQVLKRIRGKHGGFLGVSAMAFPHEGGIEIACNVDMVELGDHQQVGLVEDYLEEVMPGIFRARFRMIEEAVSEVCSQHGTKIRGDSVIVGLGLEEARTRTLEALEQNNPLAFNSLISNIM